MYRVLSSAQRTLRSRRAQLLLPSVLLLPLFVLVIYLLVEVTKVSIAKVRHQFALDNAVYSQVTSVSAFLNAVAYIDGPFPYRVLSTYDDRLKLVDEGKKYKNATRELTVFDLFFQAGSVPTVASDYEWGKNPPPNAQSTDWGVHYIQRGDWNEEEQKSYDRKGWEKETPEEIKERVVVMNKEMVEKHYVALKQVGLPAINAYISTYVQLGDTYNLQKKLYQDLIKNAGILRQGYFLNVDDCKRSECAKQSASRLAPYLSIPTKRQEYDELMVYVSASDMAGGTGGAIDVPLSMREMGAEPLFFFAYVEPVGRSRLRTFKRGIAVKQAFPLPKNNFNIDLAAKYKPYVRNTVVMSCPRANNNCVWPNPLPKYNVMLRP